MPNDHEQVPLRFNGPEDLRRLRGVLDRANYSEAGVLEAVGIKDFPSLRGSDVSLLLRRTSNGTPQDTLIRLFLIVVPVEIEAARRAVHPMRVEEWAEAGLVHLGKSAVTAAVQLLPHQGLVIAFDLPPRPGTGLKPNYVMGIGSSSLTLANLTVRRRSRLTLDLGTGCGIQAFLASPHSDRVLAVDRNPRAVQFAEFNAQLNGLCNVECLEGDMFDPVPDQQFDLVISNPPFVISPESRYIYRDSGLYGDQICQKIVREVPASLREEGYCQILCNWAHLAGQGWQERLAGWFEGTGCDAWAMCSETRDAATYAATWIRRTERDDPEEFGRRFDEWMSYYDHERIEAVSAGLITMRRCSGRANWFRADWAPEKMLGPCGNYVLRGFELGDFLEAVRDDQALMNETLRVSPDVRLEQQCEPAKDQWVVADSRIRLVRGLAYSGNVDPYVVGLIIRCDGQRRLGDLVRELAVSLERDLESIAPTVLGIVRRLVEQGFLLPVSASTDLD